jgi:hypothetical protein
MSLSVGWRIARNTSVAYSKKIFDELRANEKPAEKGAAQERGQTDNTESSPQTR